MTDKKVPDKFPIAPKEPKIKNLTETEKEVLRLYTEDFLTNNQIAIRRQTTKRAVNKILKNLKLKGAFDIGSRKVPDFEALAGTSKNSNYLRLHGQEFNIKIIHQNERYQAMRAKSNLLFIDGHTIKLYNNAIEIYSGHGLSFYADTPNRAIAKSFDYWQKFFVRLEHELRCILIKPRVRNIRLVNQHFARGNSEVYENAKENKQRILIYAEEDGKLAFVTDDSFGFKEDETIHPQTAQQDREAIDKQINDWRVNNPPTNSENATILNGVLKNQAHHEANIKSHIEAIQTMSKSLKELTEIIKKLGEKK